MLRLVSSSEAFEHANLGIGMKVRYTAPDGSTQIGRVTYGLRAQDRAQVEQGLVPIEPTHRPLEFIPPTDILEILGGVLHGVFARRTRHIRELIRKHAIQPGVATDMHARMPAVNCSNYTQESG